MRRRWVWSREENKLVEVALTYRAAPVSAVIWNDLPAYESPIDGRPVEGRKQRREDLARTGCRPWEGREQEVKEAAKVQASHERGMDQLAEKIAHTAWAEAPERVRKVFRGR